MASQNHYVPKVRDVVWLKAHAESGSPRQRCTILELYKGSCLVSLDEEFCDDEMDDGLRDGVPYDQIEGVAE